MQTIWKFTLGVVDEQSVDMPLGAKVLAVAEQNGAPCLWALVDPEAEPDARAFCTYGTGHSIEVTEGFAIEHVGSYQLSGGGFVGHVFELIG